MPKVKSQDHPEYAGHKLPANLDESNILEMAADILNRRLRTSSTLEGPEDVEQFIRNKLHSRKDEHFAVLFLDVRHRLIEYEELFHGTIDGASVYPRVICRRCLELNAAAIIVAHNHPSGVAEPSKSDQSLTRRLTQAMDLIDVRLLDHFIVGDGEYISFARRGYL